MSDQAHLEKVWSFAKPRLQRRILELELCTQQGNDRPEIRRQSHRLAGTLGCFGLSDASQLARKLESQALQAELSALVTLVRHLKEKIDQSEFHPVDTNPRARIAALLSDEFQLVDLLAFGHMRSLEVIPITHLGELLGKSWGLLLLDLSHPQAGHLEAGLGIPVVGLIPEDNLAHRLKAIASGASTVCPVGDGLKSLFNAIPRILQGAEKVRPGKVLVLEGDPAYCDRLHHALDQEGYQVEIVTTPDELWLRLETFVPDLLLLSADLPRVNGEQLCRVFRADDRWRDLPIIFLSDTDQEENSLKLYRAGADDLLLRSANSEVLLARLANRRQRHQTYSQSLMDPLTTLPTRRVASQSLERLLALARRQQVPFSLAVLDLDHFKQVNDIHGHLLGDQVLATFGQLVKSFFRCEDVVCRWGGEEFVVGQLDCNAAQATARIDSLLAQFQTRTFSSATGSLRVSFSAGVAEGFKDIRALYREADAALYKAKQGGRACVVRSHQEPSTSQAQRRTDVVLVEDDPEMAHLILTACQSRGFHTEHYSDGLDTLRAWLDGRLGQPRVMLLDNDLPGMDGLQLIRRLSQENRLGETHIITLSGRMEELEILEAIDLGAFDHVEKPFSLSGLMHKLEQLIYQP